MKTLASALLVLVILLSPLTKPLQAHAKEDTSPSLAPPPATEAPLKVPDTAAPVPTPGTGPASPSALDPGPQPEVSPTTVSQQKETVEALPANPIIKAVSEVPEPPQPVQITPQPPATQVVIPSSLPKAELHQPLSPKSDQGRGMRLTGAIFGATAVALLVAGVFFTYKTHAYTNLVQSEPVFNTAWANRGSLYEKLQWTAYGLAAGTALTGSILYWFGKSQSSERTSFAWFPLSGGAAVTVKRTF